MKASNLVNKHSSGVKIRPWSKSREDRVENTDHPIGQGLLAETRETSKHAMTALKAMSQWLAWGLCVV